MEKMNIQLRVSVYLRVYDSESGKPDEKPLQTVADFENKFQAVGKNNPFSPNRRGSRRTRGRGRSGINRSG